MDAKLSISDAAKWFIENNDSVTPKKLQKLLYYLYAWGLVFLNEDIDDLNDKVFSGKFEAWVHGPVNRDVYEEYKSYGGNLIKISDANEMKIENPDTLNLMKQINRIYGKYDGNTLELLTHSEDPWKKARGSARPLDRCQNVLDDADMFKFYSSLLEG